MTDHLPGCEHSRAPIRLCQCPDRAASVFALWLAAQVPAYQLCLERPDGGMVPDIFKAGFNAAMATMTTARPAADWHDDDGPVLWWRFPIEEPPYCGTPYDFDTNDRPVFRDRNSYTHWTRLPIPSQP